MIVALDWDGVLADPQTHQLTDTGRAALYELRTAGHQVIVHTCRANWQEGLDDVRRQLAKAGIFSIDVWAQPGKPNADLYVDDRAVHFDGDWQPLLRHLRGAPIEHTAPAIKPPARARRPKRQPQSRTWS